MTKLSDLQSLLLATAASRDSGSLVPYPTTKAPAAGVAKAVAALVTKGFAEEREVADAALACRRDGDLATGVFITSAGKQAIGVEEPEPEPEPTPGPAAAEPARADRPARATKAAAVLALLQREGGATLAELVAATGWLPHTTRAALTGLRKKGHALEKAKRDGVTCYRVAAQ